MAKMDMDKKNINRLYDMYYKALANIREVVESVISSIGVMKKSDYDKNNNGIVDNSEKVVLTSQSSQVTDTTIRFGVDPDGKWGYIKEGADTVTPFKSGGIEPTGNKDLGTITSNGTYTGYDVTDYATASITVNVPGVVPTGNVNLGTITSNGYKSGFNVSGKATCSFTVQVPLPSGNVNLGTITSNGTYTGYDVTNYATASITVNVPGSKILPSKTTTVIPPANWSGSVTGNATILTDIGYDGINTIYVNVPMLRDGTLMNANTLSTPSTVYNGDDAESNSDLCLRLSPSKDGMSYNNSYLYLKPDSLMGDAEPEEVLEGSTFSSESGFQQRGTLSLQQVKGGYMDFSLSTLLSGVGLQFYPDSGHTAMKEFDILFNTFLIGSRESGSATGAFTMYLDSAYTNFQLIVVAYKPHVNASPVEDTLFYEFFPVEFLRKFNNTSTSKFLIGGRAVQSTSSTSGSVYVRLFRFETTTQMYFHNGQQVNGTNTSNSAIIPYKIYGIKGS